MRVFVSLSAAVVASTLAFAFFCRAGGAPAAAATPPPSPPPMGGDSTLATPTPIAPPNGMQFPPPATPLPGNGAPAPAASASPTPPPDARKGIEGVWEVQIQRPNVTDYTHFKLAQSGNTLSGTYLDARGKKYPLAGAVDGENFRLIVTMPDGTTMLLEGRLDGTTDMVGMLTTPKEQVPFTAAYRPKEKWIENVNPSPGGIGAPNGGYTPP